MSTNPPTELSVRDITQGVAIAFGGSVPAEALAKMTQGCDPRFDTSPLYDILYDIKKDDDRMPTEEEYRRISDLVLENPNYRKVKVGLKEALKATEILMKYIHPTLRSIEVKGDSARPVILGDVSPADIKKIDQILQNV